MNLDEIYKQLTNVDIEKQKQLWNDRGKGYYGEFLVFCELYKNIIGNCKILMNLNIPTEKEKTTEVDLILIHETGIYVFEIKHHKGTIYGSDTGFIWTQYFRTVKNNTFKNPILQNEYHINALKKIFTNIPIKSVIVFTNPNCNIKVEISSSNIYLCTIYNLNKTLEYNFKNSEVIFSIKEIDEIFEKLSKYSQMQEIILYNGKEESFISWLQPTLQKLEEEKNKLNKQVLENKRNTLKRTIINAIIAIVCILWITISLTTLKSKYNNDLQNTKEKYNNELKLIEQNYNSELEKFKQNFKHIDEIDNQYINALNEYFSVSDVLINTTSDNAVTFSAKISRENDTYGMALTKKSKYIVMTSNNKVYEYDVFGKHLTYNKYHNMLGKGIRDYGNLAQINFYGISKNEINYIKITNIDLFKLDVSKTIIKQNLELELYSK